ncbi:hypothetical protein GW17_00003048 [Ensete ventricosum]|nr:hypothetical protein GW17_00003048 [Ensete ventricosum]
MGSTRRRRLMAALPPLACFRGRLRFGTHPFYPTATLVVSPYGPPAFDTIAGPTRARRLVIGKARWAHRNPIPRISRSATETSNVKDGEDTNVAKTTPRPETTHLRVPFVVVVVIILGHFLRLGLTVAEGADRKQRTQSRLFFRLPSTLSTTSADGTSNSHHLMANRPTRQIDYVGAPLCVVWLTASVLVDRRDVVSSRTGCDEQSDTSECIYKNCVCRHGFCGIYLDGGGRGMLTKKAHAKFTRNCSSGGARLHIRVANFTRDAAGKFIRPEGGDGGDYEVVVPSTVATSMTSSFMEYEMGVMVTALAHVVAGGRGTVAATDMSASTSTMFPTSSPSSGGEQGGQKRGSDDFKLEEVAKLRRTVGEFGESSSTPAGDSIAVLGVSGGSLSSSSSSLLHGSFSQLNSNLRIYCVSNFHICSLCSNGTNCISSSCCRNRSGYPFDHLRNRASRSENKIQRGAATPVGQMGGGDKRPSQGRPRLARHLQHRRGGRPGLRRGRPPLPRKQSQAQLPGQGTTPARAAGRSVRPGTRPRRSRGAAGVPPVRRSPSHSRRRERLLGLLEAAARRRGVPEDASRFSLGSHDVFYGFCCCLGLLPFIAFFIYFIPVCSSPSSIFSSVLFSRNVATDRLLPTSTMEGI